MTVPSAEVTVSICVPSSLADETGGQRRTHRISPSAGAAGNPWTVADSLARLADSSRRAPMQSCWRPRTGRSARPAEILNYPAAEPDSAIRGSLSRSKIGSCCWSAVLCGQACERTRARTYSGQRRHAGCDVMSFRQVNDHVELQAGAFCETVGSACVGSNPTPATPAETAPGLRKRGPAAHFLLVTLCISARHPGSMCVGRCVGRPGHGGAALVS